MSDSHRGWDDDRLNAAFAGRAAAAPVSPSDLVDEVLALTARMERPSGVSHRFPRFGPLLGLAAVVTVAIAFAVGQFGRGTPVATQGPSGQPGSGSPGAATQSEGAAAPPDPLAVLAEPITVSQAIAVRDGGVDDRELAVAGYLSPIPTVFCTFIPADVTRNLTALYCPESFQWLMERPESLWSTSGNTTSGGPPKGPAFHLSLRLVPSDGLVNPAGPAGNGATSPPPVKVVLVGHFDDRRAAPCPTDPAPETPCADTFVVDRVAAIRGVAQPVTTRPAAPSQANAIEQPVSTADEIDGLVRAAGPGVAILSRQLHTGDQLAWAEPSLADDATLINQRLIWIVTTVGLRDGVAVARTFLVVDGTTRVLEITS
jgi:hypothetical protein